jgi:hypothetical protein
VNPPTAPDLGASPADFSEEEMMVVLALSLPIEKDRRNAFLSAVAGALAASPVRGAGAAHGIGREIQREYFIPPEMSEPHPKSTARREGYGWNRASR